VHDHQRHPAAGDGDSHQVAVVEADAVVGQANHRHPVGGAVVVGFARREKGWEQVLYPTILADLTPRVVKELFPVARGWVR
jgi:hypothetical protein